MATSQNARRLEIIARGIGAAKLQAFRRTGSVFRREVEPGFLHIIDLGLGPSWSTYAGQFTVDVCVFVGEAYELFFSKPCPRRLTGSHCDLRMGLGLLRSPPKDQWWDVSLDSAALVAEVGDQIEGLALPFLARLESRRAFVEAWRASGNESLGLPPRGDLIVAAMLTGLGERAAAREVLNLAVAGAVGQRRAAFYSEIAARLGAAIHALPAKSAIGNQ